MLEIISDTDTVVPVLRTLSREDTCLERTNNSQQVLRIHVMLPLTKGHLSTKDRIVWEKGCLY